MSAKSRRSHSSTGGPGSHRWLGAVSLVSTVGFLCAFTEWGWPGLLASAGMIALFAAAFSTAGWADDDRGAAARMAKQTIVVGCLVVAAAGLVSVFHVAGSVVIVLLLLSSQVVSRIRQKVARVLATGGVAPRNGGLPHPGDDVLTTGLAPFLFGNVRLLDDEALCLAWRRSFLRLGRAGSTEEKMLVVGERELILDELHRRSAEGLAAWWCAGGRASGSPLPFLDPHHSRADPGARE